MQFKGYAKDYAPTKSNVRAENTVETFLAHVSQKALYVAFWKISVIP
jgi:hypothetical protein